MSATGLALLLLVDSAPAQILPGLPKVNVPSATLSDPAPEVLLDDFGSDAPVFRLRYWLRLGGERSGPIVDSDIRLDIETAPRDAGIAMAFPQRDVHLDSVAPTRVELSRARAEPGALDALGRPAAPSPQDAL